MEEGRDRPEEQADTSASALLGGQGTVTQGPGGAMIVDLKGNQSEQDLGGGTQQLNLPSGDNLPPHFNPLSNRTAILNNPIPSHGTAYRRPNSKHGIKYVKGNHANR